MMIKFIKTFFAKKSRYHIPVSCSESQRRLIHFMAQKRGIPTHMILQEVFDNGCRASYNQLLLSNPRFSEALPSYQEYKLNHIGSKASFHYPSAGF